MTISPLALALNCSTHADRTALFGNMSTADGVITPYEICTPGQLRNIRFYPDKSFILGDDLDFDYSKFDPIVQTFSGELDGNSKTIARMIISVFSPEPIGIFQTVVNANIHDITFVDSYVEGSEKVGLIAGQWRGGGTLSNINLQGLEVVGTILTGGLIGLNNENGTNQLLIDSITISGPSIVSGTNNVGGLIGLSNSLANPLTMQNISSDMIINGTEFTGGLVGQSLNNNFDLENINLTGTLNCYREFCGGIAGRTQFLSGNLITTTSSLTSFHHSVDAHVGGLVGHNVHHLILTNSTYTGDINAQGNIIGGIVGATYTAAFDNIITSGTITAIDNTYDANTAYVGGILGSSHHTIMILNSSSSMDINSHGHFTGGLAGRIDDDASTIDNSFATGDISARTSFIGGLAGFFDGKLLTNSYATGNISNTNPTPKCYAGGLLGYANSWNSEYENLYALGNVTVTNGTADYLGGLVGFFRGGVISKCYANGDVLGGRNNIGGLIGILRGDLTECYSIGTVVATGNHIGGLIGHFNAGLVTKAFSLSNVTAKMNAGGLIGTIYAIVKEAAVSNSYSRGIVTKLGTSTEDPFSFGRFIGTRTYGANQGAEIYASTKNKVIDALTGIELVGRNSFGKNLGNAKMKDPISFPGLDFVNTWSIRTDNYLLPNTTIEQLYPMLNWAMTK